jgi:hypothetical protein
LRLWDLVLLRLLSWGFWLRLLRDWMLLLWLWHWMLLRRGGGSKFGGSRLGGSGLGGSTILRRTGWRGFLHGLCPREERASQEYAQWYQNSAGKRGSVAGLHDVSSITPILRGGHSLQEKMARKRSTKVTDGWRGLAPLHQMGARGTIYRASTGIWGDQDHRCRGSSSQQAARARRKMRRKKKKGKPRQAAVLPESYCTTAKTLCWIKAGRRFAHYAKRRRRSSCQGPKRLLADFIIGSHALSRADRFMTLDPKRYAPDFPELKLLSGGSPL